MRDRRVLVVEDSPTTTHGGMSYGAGYVAAKAIAEVAREHRVVVTHGNGPQV